MFQNIFDIIDIIYYKLSYIFRCVLPLKIFLLYIYRPRDTINKQTFIQPIIFFLHSIREVTILWPNPFIRFCAPLGDRLMICVGAASQFHGESYWFDCQCRSHFVGQRSWPLFDLLVMSSQPLEDTIGQVSSTWLCRPSRLVALSATEEVGRCSALSHT
jgi:hypothetical protein